MLWVWCVSVCVVVYVWCVVCVCVTYSECVCDVPCVCCGWCVCVCGALCVRVPCVACALWDLGRYLELPSSGCGQPGEEVQPWRGQGRGCHWRGLGRAALNFRSGNTAYGRRAAASRPREISHRDMKGISFQLTRAFYFFLPFFFF